MNKGHNMLLPLPVLLDEKDLKEIKVKTVDWEIQDEMVLRFVFFICLFASASSAVRLTF